MSDSILSAAIVGTERRPFETEGVRGVNRLAHGLHDVDPERKLLLMAGSRAIYAQAGIKPQRLEDVPSPAGEEELSACSDSTARLIEQLASSPEADPLLSEALQRLKLAGLRVPPGLLPLLLDAKSQEIRSALLPVMGERGRWLSRFNPEWAWVTEATSCVPASREEAWSIWEEGTQAQRLSVIRHVRSESPDTARQWIEDVWKREKVDFRAELVRTFHTGLSSADEPYLEAALDDRSKVVRVNAANLLALLPGSAFGARMRERADRVLEYVAEPETNGRFNKIVRAFAKDGKAAGRLEVTLPSEPDAQAQRDCIETKSPQGIGQRVWWATQILERVPPSHWIERFQADADALIAAAKRSEFGDTLMAGWSRAAIRFEDPAWLAPLWLYTYDHGIQEIALGALPNLIRSLVASGQQQTAEKLLSAKVRGSAEVATTRWSGSLREIPGPWGTELTDSYVSELFRAISKQKTTSYDAFEKWARTYEHAAGSLPHEAFSRVLDMMDQYEEQESGSRGYGYYVPSAITKIIRTRQQIVKEIPV